MADCILCPAKATVQCSGCKRVPFCSAKCQKFFWPYHRVQCKAQSAAFVLPPLASDEASALVVAHNQLVNDYGTGLRVSMLNFMREKGLYGGGLPGLVASLSQPAPHNKRRMTLLALTIQHLHHCFTEAMLPENESVTPAQTPWQGVSPYIVTLLLPGLNGGSALTTDGEPLEVADPFLQHLLVATCLLHEYKKLDRGVGLELLDWSVLAYKRASAELRKLPLTSSVRTPMERLVETTVGVMEMMVSMAKQGMM